MSQMIIKGDRPIVLKGNLSQGENTSVDSLDKIEKELEKESKITHEILEKRCTAGDVKGVIISQINSLQQDIYELEDLKNTIKNIFPKDQRSYRSTYIIENKVKTFTAFYTTILSYKKELNFMLFKLREVLDKGTDLDMIKTAIREVITERTRIKVNTEENRQRINELLEKNPNLMPSEL